MSHESFGFCPYCHRKLEETERYCYFCEQDLTKLKDKKEKKKSKEKKKIEIFK